MSGTQGRHVRVSDVGISPEFSLAGCRVTPTGRFASSTRPEFAALVESLEASATRPNFKRVLVVGARGWPLGFLGRDFDPARQTKKIWFIRYLRGASLGMRL
jgi:hypothetical protein